MSIRRAWIAVVSLGLCAAAWAQPAPPARPADPDEPGGELRQALREHVRSRLKSELGLTDEQLAEVWPRIEHLERERRAARRERAQAVRELRRAYRDGAPDADLQGLLDRFDEVQHRAQRRERELQRDIDAALTVPQRVELRFFFARFRQELRRRLQDGRLGRDSADPRRARPWRDRQRRDGRP